MLELAPVSYLDGLLEADSFEEVAGGEPQGRAQSVHAPSGQPTTRLMPLAGTRPDGLTVHPG
jgi:hypothetical protein